MNAAKDPPPSAEVKRKLRWLVAVIVMAVVLVVSLTLILWEHSPKPP